MRPLRLRREQTCQGPLVLIDRAHPLQEGAPPELVPVDRLHPQVLLERRAARLLAACIRSVGGGRAIVPVSGWRSRAEQQAIWDDTLAEHDSAFTETYVARPGCSEHQTGLAIDLGENGPEVDFLCPAFPDSGPCGALRRRAADFGFILRYPKGKEAVTGIGYEPWHFRYVGWPHAKLMEERHLVLEEYLEWLHDFPLGGEPLRFRGLGQLFELYYLPAWAADTLTLPADVPCQRCDTNEGGVVLTLWRDAG